MCMPIRDTRRAIHKSSLVEHRVPRLSGVTTQHEAAVELEWVARTALSVLTATLLRF